jgi:hypothetical protein
MKNLKKLGAAVTLTLVLGISAFADCEPPIPGQIPTPPCAAAITRDTDALTASLTEPGDIGTPTLSKSDTSLAEIAADVLMSMLPLF